MRERRPYWGLLASLWTQEECNALVQEAASAGWHPGTYADGRPRDHVQVRFLDAAFPTTRYWIEKIRRHAVPLAELFGVDIDPAGLVALQVSRWGPGDHYGHHFDHDSTGNLVLERKLTIYTALSPGGGLDISGPGLVRCHTGDTLCFNALASHAAPPQTEGERFSVVAWVPGPHWR